MFINKTGMLQDIPYNTQILSTIAEKSKNREAKQNYINNKQIHIWLVNLSQQVINKTFLILPDMQNY